MAEGISIRDPIHNFIELTEEEVKLIATPLLQRLRGIRQLALASLVYPGAVHTRFDHTLGVCCVAGLMAKRLGLGPHEQRLVRLAALLHDVGHGPFSHVSENVLERYANRGALPAEQKKEKIHELVTAHLIRNDPEVIHLLGKHICEQIAKLLSTGHGQPVLRAIVSGPLDADKQDYLLRDSYFCGVSYGVFDLHQLHRSLTLIGAEEEKDLGIDPDGVRALEQFVLAKYYLTTNVYRHRVRLITDQMILRAIILGIDQDRIDELQQT
jgi:HD superfamily phosphohydrolase